MQIPEEIMDKIFKEMMEEYRRVEKNTKDEKPTFHNLEGAVLSLGQEFERRVLKAALEYEQKRAGKVKKKCQNCGKKVESRGLKKKIILSTFGLIPYKRSKLKCSSCGATYYPFDELLEVGRSMISKRVCKIASMIFTYSPFAHTKKIMKEALSIEISETALKSISNRIGTKLYNDMDKKSRRPEQLQYTGSPIDLMYIQADGAMTPIASAGGIEYKENKLGVIYTNDNIIQKKTKNGKDRVEIKNKRFVSSIGEGVDKFKRMLYGLAKENGLYKSDKVIILGDGASWISKMKEEYFPEAIQILDWYHAVDHLWTTAHALYGENNIEKCRKWVDPLKELLWAGKVGDVIKEIIKMANGNKKNQDSLWKLHGYLVSNKENMKYDEFRKAGYYIGSGAIESANKYIVANRLKQAGMRWDVCNANAMIWLRSKCFEDIWDAFWDNVNIADYLGQQEVLWGGTIAA